MGGLIGETGETPPNEGRSDADPRSKLWKQWLPTIANQRVEVRDRGEPSGVPLESAAHPDRVLLSTEHAPPPQVEALARLVGYVFDLESQLQSTTAELQDLKDAFHAIPPPYRVFWKDRKHVFRGINRVLGQDMNVDVEEIVGLNDYDLGFPKEQIDFFYTCDKEVMNSGTPLVDIVEPQRQKDGRTAWLSTSKAPVYDRTGQVTGLIGVYSDITRLKKIEQELMAKTEALSTVNGALTEDRNLAKAAVRARSQLLANVSHEIRTPMNGVIGLCTELIEDHDLSPDARAIVILIQSSADSLVSVVNELLDFSKIDAGKMPITAKPNDLRRETDQVLAVLRPMATVRGLYLRSEFASAACRPLYFDATRYAQILRNLVGNALKFTEHGGVTVRVDATEGADRTEIEIHVDDSGPGILTTDLSRIFEEFVQVGNTDSRLQGGTGLGLTISRKLVELMGGTLSVKSKFGVGTTFVISFVMDHAPVDDHPNTAVTSTEKVERFDGMRVLVAEDNAINQRVAQKLLERLGARVTIAEDGAIAIESLRKDEFDLVLMDIQMPNLDGVEATRRIRQIPRLAATPVVALTASALESDVHRFKAVGIEDVILKPIDTQRLKDVLAKFRN